MDPISLASKRFHTAFSSFWDPPPGNALPTPPVLRIVVKPTSRTDAVKSLRLLEWAPENRWPFLILEASISSSDLTLAALASQVEANYEKLRSGLAQDGLSIPALERMPRPVQVAALASQIARAARNVATVLAGLMVVLMPERIHDEGLYSNIAGALADDADLSFMRVAVRDHESVAPRFPGFATFEVDRAALVQYLKDAGKPTKNGPPDGRPRPTPAQLHAAELRAGKRIPSEGTGSDLRALLLDASSAMSDRNFKVAAKKFRAARMLCHLSGLEDEEAVSSIALGSVVFAAGDKKAAIAAYRAAKAIALRRNNKTLAAQAELGVAAMHFAGRAFEAARASYREVAELSVEMPPLALEAERMVGECFLAEGRTADAMTPLSAVVNAAAQLPPEIRQTTSFVHAGKTLATLYEQAGHASQARAMVQHLARMVETANSIEETGS